MTVLPARLCEARPDSCPIRLDETAAENREALMRVFDRLEAIESRYSCLVDAVEARYSDLAAKHTAIEAELVAANGTIAELQGVVVALGRLSSALAGEASRVSPNGGGAASS